MALPKINSTPSYEVTVPSTGQQVSFRPFLVKEQKTLLIAIETQSRADMVRAIVRTIEACVEQPLDGELTTFDVDYLFTKIRAKSVGETSELIVLCTECEAKNEVTVELDKIEIGDITTDRLIKLTDDISVEMRYPTYDEIISNEELLKGASVTESLIQLTITCIDAILTEEESFSTRDEPREEVLAFVESMTADQFDKLAQFVGSIPAITSTHEFDCIKCGASNTKVFEGIDDFF